MTHKPEIRNPKSETNRRRPKGVWISAPGTWFWLLCLSWQIGPGIEAYCGAATVAEHQKSHKSSVGDDIFAGTNVLRMQIEISSSGMNALRRTGFLTWDG